MKWYEKDGADNGAVISTEVRLYRNLRDYPFAWRLDDRGRRFISETVAAAMSEYGRNDLYFMSVQELSRRQTVALAERRAVSPGFVSAGYNSGLILSEDESLSITVCEDDHICIRTACAGLDTAGAYEAAAEVDRYLDGKLGFAFDGKFGYLSSEPARTGTAMTVCALMYLPALSKTSELQGIIPSCTKLGISVRSVFGTGSNQVGDIYAVSNHITMGVSEKTSCDNLTAFVRQLATLERNASESFAGDISATDRITKCVAVASGAALLSSTEMLDMLSWIRIGMNIGLISGNSTELNSLIFELQPATLNVAYGGTLDAASRDRIRAEILRSRLKFA